MFQTIGNKFIKNAMLERYDELYPHLPHMEFYSRLKVLEMLRMYKTVFLKPSNGARGNGVIKLTRKNSKEIIAMNSWGEKKTITPFNLPTWSKKQYVAQQGINIVTYKGNNFDIRVHMQKLKDWETTGIACKVCKGNLFAPVFKYGGWLEHYETVLETFPAEHVEYVKMQIDYLSMCVSEFLTNEMPGIQELGLDLVISNQYHIYILEVNTNPINRGFKTIDTDMHKKVSETKKKLLKAETQNIDFDSW